MPVHPSRSRQSFFTWEVLFLSITVYMSRTDDRQNETVRVCRKVTETLENDMG